MGWATGESGFDSRHGQVISLLYSVQTGSGAAQPPMPWVSAALSPGVKRTSAKVTTHLILVQRLKTRGAVPPTSSLMACWLTNRRGQLHLLLPWSNFRKWCFRGCQVGLQNNRWLSRIHPGTHHSAPSKNKVSGQKMRSTSRIQTNLTCTSLDN
jgi:hypothetical protein